MTFCASAGRRWCLRSPPTRRAASSPRAPAWRSGAHPTTGCRPRGSCFWSSRSRSGCPEDRIENAGQFSSMASAGTTSWFRPFRSASRRVEALADQRVTACMPQADGVDHMGGDRRGRDTNTISVIPTVIRRGEGDIDAAYEADSAAEAGAVHERDRRLGEFVEQLHRSGGRDRSGRRNSVAGG